MQHFIRGLNPRIGEEVRTFKPKIVKEAVDQAKLTEMKSGFATRSIVNPNYSKSQKPFKDDSKVIPSGSVSKSQKRKFNKFSNSNKSFKVPDLPKSVKPAKSMKQSYAPLQANSSQDKSTKRGAECWHCRQLGHLQWNCPLKGNY